MSFSTTVSALDTICQSLFGEISITIHPSAAGYSDLAIPNAISRDPTLEDDYNPLSPQGVSNLILFFNPATLPTPLSPTQLLPAHGDTATASNGVKYSLSRVKPDNEGGYVLYLRRTSPGAI